MQRLPGSASIVRNPPGDCACVGILQTVSVTDMRANLTDLVSFESNIVYGTPSQNVWETWTLGQVIARQSVT